MKFTSLGNGGWEAEEEKKESRALLLKGDTSWGSYGSGGMRVSQKEAIVWIWEEEKPWL